MFIKFLGATQTVTGSKYLITADKKKILIDCGLFQGKKELRLRNWQELPVKAPDIDYILLTHAHIDHSGYIPLLVKLGFSGKIFCTQATKDLCSILLPDSGHLHEEDARYANMKGYSKHSPALPLYTKEDAEISLAFFNVIQFNKVHKINDDLTFSFHPAGHILGAASVRVSHYDVSLLCSGDLGRQVDPIFYPPQKPQKSEYLLVESTYGDRLHSESSPLEQLADIINRTVKRGGTILIPSFAVGRAQMILYYLYKLKTKYLIPTLPIYINSPMATNATKLFLTHNMLHKLTAQETQAVCSTAHYVQSVKESIELDSNVFPKIIISASGMATGGRVLHHLKNLVEDHRNAIVFCGYQASGTRGEQMINGAKTIKMFGQHLPVRAEIDNLSNLSAHADYNDMLTWLGTLNSPPRKVFITHGNYEAAKSLKEKIEDKFDWQCEIPEYLDEVELC